MPRQASAYLVDRTVDLEEKFKKGPTGWYWLQT